MDGCWAFEDKFEDGKRIKFKILIEFDYFNRVFTRKSNNIVDFQSMLGLII